jgi:predicted SnoaL-like aldol condensation-catalyzing enzyme
MSLLFYRDPRKDINSLSFFVLSVGEGSLDGVHSSFYDLFRVAEGKLVEHWDTIEEVPPRNEWKNDNGKF